MTCLTPLLPCRLGAVVDWVLKELGKRLLVLQQAIQVAGYHAVFVWG